MTRASPLVLAALALALVCRLGFAFGYWRDKPLTRDEREYLDLAQSVASGRGLRYATDAPDRFARAPLYPMFAAGVLLLAGDRQTVFGASPGSLKLAQSALGVIVVWLIAGIAGRVAGPRAETAAAFAAALYPPLVWISAYAFSETLYLVLALLSVAAVGRIIDDDGSPPAGGGRTSRLVLAGALSGLAALTRPAHLLFIACGAGWLVWRRGPALALAFALAAAATIAPWTLRNYRQSDRWIVIAAEGGVTFWTGNHPLATGEGDLAANPALKIADLEFRTAHPGLSAEALEPLYYRAALSWIRAHPLDWAWLVARKFFYVWVPIGPSYRLHSTKYFLASLISYGVLLPLGAAGAWRRRRRTPRPRAVLLYAASGVLTALVFMPQERFRLSCLDPALIVCAATWLAPRTD